MKLNSATPFTHRFPAAAAPRPAPEKQPEAQPEAEDRVLSDSKKHEREDMAGFGVVVTLVGTGYGAVIAKALGQSGWAGAAAGALVGAVAGPLIGYHAHHNW